MITETMYIGSGDTTALLSGLKTKTHAGLLQRFVSGVKPYYNAFNSPIDACRAGAILEEIMIKYLSDDWYPQYRVVCKELDVLQSSLDFTRIKDGKIVEFIEMKSINMSDYMDLVNSENKLDIVKKKYKTYYNQVQQQLLCTGLDSSRIRFLCVYTYDDDENWARDIEENEFIDIEIKRDERVITKIMNRASIFQKIKDHYTKLK